MSMKLNVCKLPNLNFNLQMSWLLNFNNYEACHIILQLHRNLLDNKS